MSSKIQAHTPPATTSGIHDLGHLFEGNIRDLSKALTCVEVVAFPGGAITYTLRARTYHCWWEPREDSPAAGEIAYFSRLDMDPPTEKFKSTNWRVLIKIKYNPSKLFYIEYAKGDAATFPSFEEAVLWAWDVVTNVHLPSGVTYRTPSFTCERRI